MISNKISYYLTNCDNDEESWVKNLWDSKVWISCSIVVATAFYLTFWLQTDWTIEDGMIVARIARNFAEHGILSFNTNSWVSSATSPLFALMVGLLTSIGIHPIGAAKILGIIAALAGGWVLYKAASEIQPPHHAWITSTLYMLLPTTVAYATGGLETSLYALACMKALFSIWRKFPTISLLWGALASIIRPDGFLALIVVSIGIYWKERRWSFLWMIPSIALLAGFFSLHYGVYGSWVPHSMLAKAQVYHVEPLRNIERYLERMFLSQVEGLPLYVLALGGIWIVRKNWQYIWLLVWYVIYHLTFMLRAPLFDWYLHPPIFVITFFSGIAIGKILWYFEQKWSYLLQNRQIIRSYQFFLAIIILLSAVYVNQEYALSKLQNRLYERRVREAAGCWLAKHTSPNDLVFTESLGYIGFFSKNLFVDWPGLVDPSVPPLVRRLNRIEGYKRIIMVKHPRYLVLRNSEWESLKKFVGGRYKIVARFPSPFSHEGYEGYIIAEYKWKVR